MVETVAVATAEYVNCDRCGTVFTDGSRFCAACGHTLTLRPRGLLEFPTADLVPPKGKRAWHAIKACFWTALATFVVLWLIGVLWAPHQELNKQQLSKVDKGANALQLTILKRLPSAPEVRIEPHAGSNVDVYLSEFTFESMPYPDRRDLVRAAGQSWCNDLGGTEASDLFLASVKIRDIRTGDSLARYNCTLGWWVKRATGPR